MATNREKEIFVQKNVIITKWVVKWTLWYNCIYCGFFMLWKRIPIVKESWRRGRAIALCGHLIPSF